MKHEHKEPGLFASEENMVATEPITPELIDAVGLEEEEVAGVYTPLTPLEDPREGTEAGDSPTRGED